MEKKVIIGVAAVVAVVLAAGIAGAIVMNNGSGVKAYEKGDKILIATSPDFPPYDMAEGDEFIGIDMDFMRLILAKIGLEEHKDYDFVNVTFGGIVIGVQQGKYTIGASGFTQTADRMEQVLFTEEYAFAKQAVITKNGDTSIMSADDLNGKKISVQNYTTGDDLARSNYATDDESNIVGKDSYVDALLDVGSGVTDCLIVDIDVARSIVAKKTEFVMKEFELPGEDEYYAFILNKVNTELCLELSNVMRSLKTGSILEDLKTHYVSDGNMESYWKNHDFDDY